jgi:DegV family protein with EDD domain
LAAEAVADTIPVRVVDSFNVSLGEGQIVLAAARLAAEGKSIEDVAGLAEDLVPRVRVYASLDTLENLKKGGRIGGAKAMVATMLSFKPVIAVVDGAVEEEAKPRTRSRSLSHLVAKVKAQGAVEHVAVVHAGAHDLEEFLDELNAVYPRDQVLVGEVGGVIGAHAGRGTIGITFMVPTEGG